MVLTFQMRHTSERNDVLCICFHIYIYSILNTRSTFMAHIVILFFRSMCDVDIQVQNTAGCYMLCEDRVKKSLCNRDKKICVVQIRNLLILRSTQTVDFLSHFIICDDSKIQTMQYFMRAIFWSVMYFSATCSCFKVHLRVIKHIIQLPAISNSKYDAGSSFRLNKQKKRFARCAMKVPIRF